LNLECVAIEAVSVTGTMASDDTPVEVRLAGLNWHVYPGGKPAAHENLNSPAKPGRNSTLSGIA